MMFEFIGRKKRIFNKAQQIHKMLCENKNLTKDDCMALRMQFIDVCESIKFSWKLERYLTNLIIVFTLEGMCK